MEHIDASCQPTGEFGNCEKHGQYEIRAFKFGRFHKRLDHCPTCSKERAAKADAEKAAEERRQAQARFESRLQQAGIPALFNDRTFDSYVANTDGKRAALAKFRAFANDFEAHLDSGTVLLAMGKVGTGKSHLACASANQLMSSGYTAFYTSTARLFTKIRGTWSKSSEISEEQLLKQFEQIDLMILDEVGLQRGTDDEQRTLHEILEARRLNCKPTILLTNLDATALKSYLGERFIDRLSESGVRVTFDWESHRRQVRDVGGLDNLEAAA